MAQLVIASEAKQSRKQNWIASSLSLLAMTTITSAVMKLGFARLPGPAAAVAGDNAVPAAGAGIADETAPAVRRRHADRNVHGNGPVGGDAAGHLAGAGRGNLRARDVEGGAVIRAAIAGSGRECHVPVPVIGARPGPGSRRARHSRREGDRGDGENTTYRADPFEIRERPD